MLKTLHTIIALFIIILLSISHWLATNKKINYREVNQKIEILKNSITDYQYAMLTNSTDIQKEYDRVTFDYQQVEIFRQLYRKDNSDSYLLKEVTPLSDYLNNYNYKDLKEKAWIKESVIIEQMNNKLLSREYKIKWYEDISQKTYILIKVDQRNKNTLMSKVEYVKWEAVIDITSDSLPPINISYLNSAIIPLYAEWYKIIEFDGETSNWEYTIAINKFFDSIDSKSTYDITHWMYIKKWSYYYLISESAYWNYLNQDRFSFNSYDIKSLFERKYREENGIQDRYSYSKVDDRAEVLRENIYSHLDKVFLKYKQWNTSQQYTDILVQVQKNVIDFKKSNSFNDENYKDITSPEKEKIAYAKFKKNKNKLKIVDFLISYLSDEIYKNTLDDTLSDFLPKE